MWRRKSNRRTSADARRTCPADVMIQVSLSALQPGGGAVSLLENVALISEGTTGLVTWEAALHLAEWALDRRQLFAGRSMIPPAASRRTPGNS